MNLSNEGTTNTHAIKIKGMEKFETEECIVVEKALTIYLNDEEFSTMICSPGLEKELITGFLYAEGIIVKPDDLSSLTFNPEEGLVWVRTETGNILSEKLFLKRYLTSCCGKGRSSFYFANDARLTKPVNSSLCINSSQVNKYAQMLQEASVTFQRTGGVHGGALAANGQFVYFANDIGRHNVLDKLFGQAFLNKDSLADKILVFSGRVSSEILIKTAKMGCPIIIARSAPTDLALNLAEELGITVVGFARGNGMNVYTHTGRVTI